MSWPHVGRRKMRPVPACPPPVGPLLEGLSAEREDSSCVSGSCSVARVMVLGDV